MKGVSTGVDSLSNQTTIIDASARSSRPSPLRHIDRIKQCKNLTTPNSNCRSGISFSHILLSEYLLTQSSPTSTIGSPVQETLPNSPISSPETSRPQTPRQKDTYEKPASASQELKVNPQPPNVHINDENNSSGMTTPGATSPTSKNIPTASRVVPQLQPTIAQPLKKLARNFSAPSLSDFQKMTVPNLKDTEQKTLRVVPRSQTTATLEDVADMPPKGQRSATTTTPATLSSAETISSTRKYLNLEDFIRYRENLITQEINKKIEGISPKQIADRNLLLTMQYAKTKTPEVAPVTPRQKQRHVYYRCFLVINIDSLKDIWQGIMQIKTLAKIITSLSSFKDWSLIFIRESCRLIIDLVLYILKSCRAEKIKNNLNLMLQTWFINGDIEIYLDCANNLQEAWEQCRFSFDKTDPDNRFDCELTAAIEAGKAKTSKLGFTFNIQDALAYFTRNKNFRENTKKANKQNLVPILRFLKDLDPEEMMDIVILADKVFNSRYRGAKAPAPQPLSLAKICMELKFKDSPEQRLDYTINSAILSKPLSDDNPITTTDFFEFDIENSLALLFDPVPAAA